MPPQITTFFQRFGASLKSFTAGQRTLAVLGSALLVVGIVALSAWLTRPVLTPLFSGLQTTDANGIVEQLRKDNVPYELSDGGSTILVPQDKVYDERLKAAAAGLPTAAATGYSLLDKMGVTSSEFQQSVTYKRALEGELASTISAMDGVKTAAVRLAIPEKTVFVSKAPDTTASVFVETDAGATLSGDKVQAIVHLTSAAIENLKPANVSVVDSQGNVLSTVGGGTAGSSDQAGRRLPAAHLRRRQGRPGPRGGPGQLHGRRRRGCDGRIRTAEERNLLQRRGRPAAERVVQDREIHRNRGRRRRRPRPGQHRCSRRHELATATSIPPPRPRTTRSTRSPRTGSSRPEP